MKSGAQSVTGVSSLRPGADLDEVAIRETAQALGRLQDPQAPVRVPHVPRANAIGLQVARNLALQDWAYRVAKKPSPPGERPF